MGFVCVYLATVEEQQDWNALTGMLGFHWQVKLTGGSAEAALSKAMWEKKWCSHS